MFALEQADQEGAGPVHILLFFDRTGTLCLTQKCLSMTATVKLLVIERHGHTTVHVFNDRGEMHINVCIDNVLFKLPQCLNGLNWFILLIIPIWSCCCLLSCETLGSSPSVRYQGLMSCALFFT